MTSDFFPRGGGEAEGAVALGPAGDEYVDDGPESNYSPPSQDWLPAAAFDVLFLTGSLGRHVWLGRTELHTVAYLACLLSVYKGLPSSEWSYAFSAVPPTLPFSPAIESATDMLIAAGKARVGDGAEPGGAGVLRLTEAGAEDLAFLSTLEAFSPRLPYLLAASRTPLFTSLPAVVNSMAFEPQLAQAHQIRSSRMLLADASTERLYAEFEALLAVLGPSERDLIVPASLYVRYLQARGSASTCDGGRMAVSE